MAKKRPVPPVFAFLHSVPNPSPRQAAAIKVIFSIIFFLSVDFAFTADDGGGFVYGSACSTHDQNVTRPDGGRGRWNEPLQRGAEFLAEFSSRSQLPVFQEGSYIRQRETTSLICHFRSSDQPEEAQEGRTDRDIKEEGARERKRERFEVQYSVIRADETTAGHAERCRP